MAECNAGARAAGIHNQRAGGGLYLFYKRLTEFLEIPAYFIFVLDGAARPRVKRGRKVWHQPIWWTDLAIQLIEHFGYITRQVGNHIISLCALFIVYFRHQQKQKQSSLCLMLLALSRLSLQVTVMPLYLAQTIFYKGTIAKSISRSLIHASL